MNGIIGATPHQTRRRAFRGRQVVRELSSAQLAFLERDASVFDRRLNERRIVEGHGDLRPEHVCLTRLKLQFHYNHDQNLLRVHWTR